MIHYKDKEQVKSFSTDFLKKDTTLDCALLCYIFNILLSDVLVF